MNKLLSLLTGGWIAPLVASLGIAAALWAVHAIHAYGDRRAAAVQADWDADVNERRLAYAGQMEVERVKGAQHAQDIAKERKARERDGILVGSVLADTRGQLERLRATSAAVTARAVQASASSAPGSGADGSTAASGSVLDRCAQRRVDVAADAEQLATQVRGLQAWASSAVMVCAPD